MRIAPLALAAALVAGVPCLEAEDARADGATVADGARVVFFGADAVVAGAEPKGFIGALGDRIAGIRPRIRVELLAAGRRGEPLSGLAERVEGDIAGRRATHALLVLPPRPGGAPGRDEPLPELLTRLGETGARLIWLGAEPPPEPFGKAFAAVCLIGSEGFDDRGGLTPAGQARVVERLWEVMRPSSYGGAEAGVAAPAS